MIHCYRLFACLAIILSLGVALQANAQNIPTDNPYRTRYQPQGILPSYPYHWTDSLPWGRVFNIQSYRNLVEMVPDAGSPSGTDLRQSWYAAIQQAKADADAAGGGVIYFPALPATTEPGADGLDSSYFVHESIYLHSKTVLRGDDPVSAQNGTDFNYSPPSWIQFPQYNYTRGRGHGGTPNSTSFKEIANDPSRLGAGAGASNVAIVNLDINRALIGTYGSFRSVTTPAGNANIANENMRNWLVYGVRSNNVALPDPNVPGVTTQDPTSRYPYRFAGNVVIFASGGNIVVANCRFNDYLNNGNQLRSIIDESFAQPDYTTANGGTCLTGGTSATFDYNAHYGIVVNRLKRQTYNTVLGFLNNAGPESEPSHFARGNVVQDNFVYHTSRSGIHASGYGLSVRSNVIKDDSAKRIQYLQPTGGNCNTNPHPVTDVGGIDFTGWGATIEYNQVEYYRTRFYESNSGTIGYSADGNGIYTQGPGGTTVKDVIIRHNTIISSASGLCDAFNSGQGKGFTGASNSLSIENVRIDSNDLGGTPIVVDGNNGATSGVASNILIRSNTNVRGISLSGVRGGNTCFIYGNIGSTRPISPPNQTNCLNGTALGTIIRRTCQVSLNADPTLPDNNQNTGLTPNPSTCIQNTSTICNLPSAQNWPRIRIAAPTDSIVVITPPTDVIVRAEVVINGCDADSLVAFKNGFRVAPVPFESSTQSYNATFSYPGASAVNFVDYITFIVYKTDDNGTVVAASTSRVIRLIVTDIKKRSTFAGQVTSYPNPAQDRLNVEVQSNRTGALSMRLLDITGREQLCHTVIKSSGVQNTALSMSSLPAGTYILEVSDASGRSIERVVKN